MPTYSAFTTLDAREPAEALSEAMEDFLPEPVGIGVFEIEDGSGRYEVGVYFEERPDETELALLSVIYGARPFVVSEGQASASEAALAFAKRWETSAQLTTFHQALT